MTKRRRLCSNWQRWAVPLLGGLLLLAAWTSVRAANPQPSGKPVVSKAANKAANKPARVVRKKAAQGRQPETGIGPAEMFDADATGLHGQASFYGEGFHGRRTATGERFVPKQFTGASNHFPLGTKVAVRRLDNDRCAIVKVNDRMHARHRRRVIDVSRGVAEYLDMVRAGVVLVRVAALKAGDEGGAEGACDAAFEPEKECVACGRPPRLPDFGELNVSRD